MGLWNFEWMANSVGTDQIALLGAVGSGTTLFRHVWQNIYGKYSNSWIWFFYRFEWTKNGEILNISDPKYKSKRSGDSRIIRVSEGTGTLMISELEKADEGIYQCKASNRYGTSLSKKVQLVKATIGIFKEKDKDVKRYRVVPAISLKVTCNPPESDPPGKTKWVKYIKDETDTRSVQLDDRVAVDDDGMLVFCCCIFLFFFFFVETE